MKAASLSTPETSDSPQPTRPNRARRALLGRLVWLLSGAYLLVRFLLPKGRREESPLLVKKSAIPPNGALVYRKARVGLIRDAQGVYALSLVCTHLGCTVTVTQGEIVCPCHGSVFDQRGNVLRGPASRPLVKLSLEDRGDSFAVRA